MITVTRKIETMKTETLLRQLDEITNELRLRFYDTQVGETVSEAHQAAVLGADALLDPRTAADRHLGRLLRSLDDMMSATSGNSEKQIAARNDLGDISGSTVQIDSYLREHDERFGTKITPRRPLYDFESESV